jgi:hypothetical protein
LAAIDTRDVRADAVQVDRASLPDADVVGGWGRCDIGACLEEAFSGDERYEFPARAEIDLFGGVDLEPEAGKISSRREVNLPQPLRRDDLERTWSLRTSGTRMDRVIVFVNVIRPAESDDVGRKGCQWKRKVDRGA